MSFNDFLTFISNGFTIFYNSFTSISNYLFTNYIFLVLIGICLFIGIVYFFYDFFTNLILKNKNLDLVNTKGGKL